jgi:hypothetical protein
MIHKFILRQKGKQSKYSKESPVALNAGKYYLNDGD